MALTIKGSKPKLQADERTFRQCKSDKLLFCCLGNSVKGLLGAMAILCCSHKLIVFKYGILTI